MAVNSIRRQNKNTTNKHKPLIRKIFLYTRHYKNCKESCCSSAINKYVKEQYKNALLLTFCLADTPMFIKKTVLRLVFQPESEQQESSK